MIRSVEWLASNLEKENLIILDASLKAKKAREAQIPGSRYFDLPGKFSDKNSAYPNTMPTKEDFEKQARALGINSDSQIIIYDNVGVYSAPRVWFMLKSMGHDSVSVLDGGLPAWVSAGHEVEEIKSPSYDIGNFIAKENPNAFKSFEELVENIDKEEYLVLDARSAGRFHGSAPEPRKELKSGHIPKSQSLPFTEVLENGKFKSKDELQEVFKGEKPLMFTCGSGLTACITLLAAELVDTERKKVVFDGSWTEWAMRNGLRTDS